MFAVTLLAWGATRNVIASEPRAQSPPFQAKPANGPLRLHPTNPRYFTNGTQHDDGTLRAMYLTGAHTWASLADIGKGDPPPAFDYEAYLDSPDGGDVTLDLSAVIGDFAVEWLNPKTGSPTIGDVLVAVSGKYAMLRKF